MKSMMAIISWLAFSALAPAFALDATIRIPTRNISDGVFLKGEDPSTSPVITITGHLTGPDAKTRHPVVILLHGADGPRSGAAGMWRAFLNENGISTLRLDSYTGRGIEQIMDRQDAIGQFVQIYDAYRAADVLAADPRIDGSRIAIMGFSRGGNAALYSALARFHNAFGPQRAKIAVHLPFYPACNIALKDELAVAAAPIRLFQGAKDDWTPSAPCRAYIDRLRAAGADAEMFEYPGALHGFDNPGNPAYLVNSENQTSRNCFRKEENGELLNAATNEPFSYSDACVEYGPSTQYNDSATTAAKAEVMTLLSEVFGKPGEQ